MGASLIAPRLLTTWCVGVTPLFYGGLSRSFLNFHIVPTIILTLSCSYSLNSISINCLSLFLLHHFLISLLFLFSPRLGHVIMKCFKSSSSLPHSLHIILWFLFLLCINSSTCNVLVLAFANILALKLFL